MILILKKDNNGGGRGKSKGRGKGKGKEEIGDISLVLLRIYPLLTIIVSSK